MGEERLKASQRCTIVETVLEILKASDLETATEVSIRAAASERLGFDLSELTHRRLVRQLIDSFLLSTATSMQETTPSNNDENKDINEMAVNNQKKQQQEQKRFSDKVICKLSDRRRVVIHDFKGRTMVSVRDFYSKDGIMHPRTDANSGISLTTEQWSSFRNNFPLIQEAIKKLESRLRSDTSPKQSEAEMRTSVVASVAENIQVDACNSDFTSIVHTPFKRKQTEADTYGSGIASNTQENIASDREHNEAGTAVFVSTSNTPAQVSGERRQAEDAVPSQEPSQYGVNVTHAERLIPIQPARLTGRNYHSWRHHMELFLRQLNLAYVLTEPCPSMSFKRQATSNEKAEAQGAIRRWVDDDYMCHNNILQSLSDNLFQRYSGKSHSARDLWEELKLLYNEDFGTRSSEINKYINFQMVDGVSVLEQVQELHNIVGSMIAQGIWMDENFHISAIVSKLPPSWKELRLRLMQEEFLTLSLLMHRLQVEEESRSFYKKETNYNKGRTTESRLDHRSGMRNERACYSCGREGHIVKNCPEGKSEFSEKNNEKGSAFTYRR